MEQPSRTKIMIVSDVDTYSLNCLAEKYVTQLPDIDCIICIGPFHQENNESIIASGHHNDEAKSKESAAIELSAISSMIATLEQIQCRVIYLPSGQDPIASYQNQLYLTPNSVNIHARKMSLYPNLFISGFTETSAAFSENTSINNINTIGSNGLDEDRLLTTLPVEMIENEGDQEDMVGVEVTSGLSSIHMIEELICTNKHDILPATATAAASSTLAKGIFILNYRFTHTLNHFLFHMPEILENAGINICIVLSVPTTSTAGNNSNNNSSAPSSLPSSSSSLHLPKKFGALNIISPVSLRIAKEYTILTLEQSNSDAKGWILASNEILKL